MKDLIKALQILSKYLKDPFVKWPTCCEHDVLYVMANPNKISSEDVAILHELGFEPDYEHECIYSYRYGSC